MPTVNVLYVTENLLGLGTIATGTISCCLLTASSIVQRHCEPRGTESALRASVRSNSIGHLVHRTRRRESEILSGPGGGCRQFQLSFVVVGQALDSYDVEPVAGC